MDEVSDSVNTAVIDAPGRFRFPICCFIFKPQRNKCYWGQRSSPDFALFDAPVKFQKGVGKRLESFIQVQTRTKSFIYFWRGIAWIPVGDYS